jgi:PAS domain S-box-containing protein
MNPAMQPHLDALGLDESKAPTPDEWRAFLTRVSDALASTRASEQRPDEAAALLKNMREKSLAVLQKNAAAVAENLALMTAVQESVADAIMVVGIGGKLLSMNRRFREMCTLPPELASTDRADAVLEHLKSIVKDPEQLRAMVRTSVEDPNAVYTNQIDLKDGRIFDRYVAPVPTRDGKLYGRVICYRDVTEQRTRSASAGDRMTAIRTIADKLQAALDAQASNAELATAVRELRDAARAEASARST